MKRAPRPKLSPKLLRTLFVGCLALLPLSARAQAPFSSSYATRDGHASASILGCASADGSFTAQICGVAGFPLHVQVDGGGGTPTTAPGASPGQVVAVQGGGAGSLPVAVAQSGVWTLALPNGSHLALDAGGNVIGGVTQSGAWSVSVSNLPATQAVTGSVSVTNLPATQAVSGAVTVSNLQAVRAISATSLPLPTGAATAAGQSALNADGGSQVHLVNPLPAGTNAIGSVVEANRSGAWTDASFTATATASSPSGLVAIASRVGLHVWNVGSVTACMNYTAVAVASGSGCAAGSVPIPAGSAYLEDQPGNVSPEAISLVCAGTSCPLTIKVR